MTRRVRGDPMIKFSTRHGSGEGRMRFWSVKRLGFANTGAGEYPWSDDFSNLLGPLIASFGKRLSTRWDQL